VSDPPMMNCYRHPDRWTGVTCQRCNRPICPTCMKTASVGYQCPECVHEGARAAPVMSARQALRQGSTPYLTYGLMVGNVAIFVISYALNRQTSLSGLGQFDFDYALIPPFVGDGEWYRILTGAFMHAGLLHLGMNMFVLWSIGSVLEPAIGRWRFGLGYAVSLVGGALGVVLLYSPGEYTVGASGAIFGTFGLLAMYQLSRGINPMQSGIGATVILNLLITFAIPGISVGGHLGGLVVGAIAGAVMFVGPRSEDHRMAKQALAERVGRDALVVVIGIACLVLTITQAQALIG